MMVRVIDWVDAPPELKARHILKVYSNGKGWTTEPPTEPGLYRVFHQNIEGKFKNSSWASWEELKKGGNYLVIVLYDDEEIVDRYIESEAKDGFRLHWLGPIPTPEAPQGL